MFLLGALGLELLIQNWNFHFSFLFFSMKKKKKEILFQVKI